MREPFSIKNYKPRNSKQLIWIILGSVLLLAFWICANALQKTHQDLTIMPERSIGTIASSLTPEESTLTVSAQLSLAEIRNQIDSKIPVKHDIPETRKNIHCENGEVGKVLGAVFNRGRRICVDADYSGEIKRTPIAVRTEGEVLILSTTLQADGNIGLNGDLAGAFELDKKNLSGTADIEVRVAFNGVSSVGAPNLEVIPDLKLRNAKFEIIGGTWVDLTPFLKSFADATVISIKLAAAQALSADAIEERLVNSTWESRVIEFGSPDAPMFALFEPSRIGLSKAQVNETAIALTGALSGYITVSPEAPKNLIPPTSPKFDAIDSEQSSIRFSIASTFGYENVMAALEDASPIEIRDGKTTLRFDDIDIYTSNDRVAVTFDVDADLPNLFGDVRGRIGLTARPEILEKTDGHVIVLEDLEFAREIDNVVWSYLTAAGKDLIINEIKTSTQISLEELSKEIEARANQVLSAEGEKGKFSAEIDDLAISFPYIQATGTGIELVVTADAIFQAESEFASLR